jgi:TIGR01777 family protein
MRVIIAGGSGFIGRRLIVELLQDRHEIILLSRRPENVRKTFPAVRVEYWDTKTGSVLTNIIDGAGAVINLTGESIAAKRWSSIQKQKILSSRIDSTRAIVNALEHTPHRPSVLLNASAVGYYAHVPEGEVTETYPKGNGFLPDVCNQSEMEAQKAQEFGVRVVLLRTGIVLDKSEGALHKLLLPFRMFIGGPLGNGRRWFPWIHVQDEVNAILYAMEHERIDGPLNLAAPQSIRMIEFCNVLGSVLHRPSWLPVPGFALRLILGEMAEPLLFQGQKIIPKKLLEADFKFQFPNLENALQDILR